jgi:hypothetical protein
MVEVCSEMLDTKSKFTRFIAQEDLNAKDSGIVRLFCIHFQAYKRDRGAREKQANVKLKPCEWCC